MARTRNKLIFAKRAPAFRFIGHYACLDFVNTEANKSGEVKDLLRNYEDFITWLASAKLFSRNNLTQALEQWRGKAAAERIFKQALTLRNCLGEMAGEIVHARSVPRAAIQALNNVIGRPSGTTRLLKTAQGFERRFEPDLKEPTQLLVPIAESAASLLCRGDLSRVKECASSHCGAFFYDTSKNRKRRWCSGNVCGNRMRVAAFYERQRL
ncbi:MAG: ABATE domain-containing protein [Candidatus Binatus sp.]